MPAPAHVRIVWIGTIGPAATPVEEFVIGVNASPGNVTPGSPFVTRANMEALATGVQGHFRGLADQMSNMARSVTCKVSYVGDNGRVAVDADGAYVQGEVASAHQGAGTAPIAPQLSIVYSLRTVADGPTGRGRFYLPCPALSGTQIGGDGRISAGTQTAHVTAGKTFLDAMNTTLVAQDFGRVVVASGGSALKGISPALRPVTRVEVGRAIDTQRRRRGDLVEEYAGADLA